MTKYTTITPSQYFDEKIACTTVGVNEYQNGEIQEALFLITSNREKIPLDGKTLASNNLIMERAPTFSDSWESEDFENFIELQDSNKSFAETFCRIREKFKTLLVFEDERYFDFITCWIIGTYFHRLMNSFPYLHFNGHAACGKTKTISFISKLAFRGKHSTNTTAAALIRTIHSDHITCCIDESEGLNRSGDDNQALLSMLNSGYKRGSFTEKCEKKKDGGFKIIKLDSYSPKVFAGIKGLDPVLATRCIPIMMPPIEVGRDILFRDIDLEDIFWAELRSDLYTLMLTKFKEVRSHYKDLKPIDKNINPREWELWKPILSIGKMVDEEVFEELWKLMEDSRKLKKSTNDDALFQISLLECLIEMMDKTPSPNSEYPVAQIHNFLANSDRNEFHWVQEKKSHTWIGDHLRKLSVVYGQATQRKIGGFNQRCFKFDREIIQKRLKALNH